MNARDIILAPVITEKAVQVIGEKKYTFRVAKTANKIEIAKAAEEIFGVKVLKVNTVSMMYIAESHVSSVKMELRK